MRPNLNNPPRIDNPDPDRPLIEQVDGIYWQPFDSCIRHCFNLSRWHIAFSGELIDYGYAAPRYAAYNTDIFDERNYPRYVGQGENTREIWNENTPQLHLELANIENTACVHIGEDKFGQVGHTVMGVDIIRFRPEAISGFGGFLEAQRVKHYIVSYKNESAKKKTPGQWLWPKTEADIQELELKGRSWLQARSGFSRSQFSHRLYSALDDQHLITVYYQPQFWGQGCKSVSDKAIEISLHPLWDFMDNLVIEEIDPDNPLALPEGSLKPDGSPATDEGAADDNDIEW